MLHSPDEVFRVSEADRQKPRSEMKCWRLESERAKLFVPEISSKALQIKNVVELSFLRPSAVPEVLKNMNERTMLRSNEESETEPWRLLWYSGRGLIFRIATAKGAPLMRSPVQRRGRRLAELLPVGTGDPAHMREAEIEDIDDACVGAGLQAMA